MEKGKSNQIVKNFGVGTLDFVYLDLEHDYVSVREDLINWWPIVREGGILALRNYRGNPGLKQAADEFCRGKRFEVEDYTNEILILK